MRRLGLKRKQLAPRCGEQANRGFQRINHDSRMIMHSMTSPKNTKPKFDYAYPKYVKDSPVRDACPMRFVHMSLCSADVACMIDMYIRYPEKTKSLIRKK